MNMLSKHGATQTRFNPGGALSGSTSTDSGVVALSPGDVSKAVVFNVPFTAAPSVSGQISLPSASGDGIIAWPDESTRTATGVTFVFSQPIPASGTYKLAWQASGA